MIFNKDKIIGGDIQQSDYLLLVFLMIVRSHHENRVKKRLAEGVLPGGQLRVEENFILHKKYL